MHPDGNDNCAIYDETSPATYWTAGTTYLTATDGGDETSYPCGYYLELWYISGTADSGEWYFYINGGVLKHVQFIAVTVMVLISSSFV